MSKECETCDSTSMEICLLIRHCPYFVDRHDKDDKHIKDSTELSGGHLW